MRILLFEDDLLWTSRLTHAAKQFGAETVVVRDVDQVPAGDVAVVNLSHRSFDLAHVAVKLRQLSILSIAHAGHKEKPLLELGRVHGFDRIATNGEMAHKLEGLLTDLISSAERLPEDRSQNQ